jgi:hypothetical protein
MDVLVGAVHRDDLHHDEHVPRTPWAAHPDHLEDGSTQDRVRDPAPLAFGSTDVRLPVGKSVGINDRPFRVANRGQDRGEYAFQPPLPLRAAGAVSVAASS